MAQAVPPVKSVPGFVVRNGTQLQVAPPYATTGTHAYSPVDAAWCEILGPSATSWMGLGRG